MAEVGEGLRERLEERTGRAPRFLLELWVCHRVTKRSKGRLEAFTEDAHCLFDVVLVEDVFTIAASGVIGMWLGPAKLVEANTRLLIKSGRDRASSCAT